MAYSPSTDFVGLWRAVSGGVQKAEMPGLDFVVAALGRAGILNVVISATAPTANQSTTAWFQPANPSFGAEGALFLWNGTAYVPATPALLNGIGSGGGGSAIISPSPPLNPVTGALWWDGTHMSVWTGSAWQITSGGTSTLVFAIAQPVQLSMTGGAFYMVPFNTVPQVDTMSGWNPVSFKYTPTKSGYYAFSVRSVLPTGGGGIALTKNDPGTFGGGAGDITICISMATPSISCWQSAVGFSQMNGTSDYVRYFAWTSPGTLLAAGSTPVFTALYMP